MKHCATLAADPPGLAAYRAANPASTVWSALDVAAYRELADALEARQRGLCAFCESRLVTDVPTPARQVEHWRPKAQAGNPVPAITFGSDNMHAACLGGTKPHLAPPFGTLGMVSSDQLSCGQKKGEFDPDVVPIADRPYRPTELPITTAAFSFDLDGQITPNASAVGLSAHRLARTIEVLGLDCERLRIVRERVRSFLADRLIEIEKEIAEPDDDERLRQAMVRLAQEQRVSPGMPLPPFISVIRDFLGQAFESTLLPDPGWTIG